MDNTYGEFQDTELDPSLDFDFEDEEENDLLPILGLAALFASVVGGMLVLIGRRRQPSAADRAQEALAVAGKGGQKALKAAAKTADDLKLRSLLDDALEKARDVSPNGDASKMLRDAQKKAKKVAKSDRVQDLLKEARDRTEEARKRAEKAAREVDVQEAASTAGKRAAGVVAGIGLGEILSEALSKATEATKRSPAAGDAVAEARKRVEKLVADSPVADLDTDKAGKFLDDLKEKLVEVIDQLRNEVAPKAADAIQAQVVPAAQTVAQRLQEDVLPAAQDAVERLRSDVIPAAQERAGKLAEEYEVAPRARKAAEAARSGAGSFNEVLRGLALAIASKIVDEVFPEAKKTGAKLATKAREEVLPAAADQAGQAATTIREEVIPAVGAAAAQTPGMLGDLLEMARGKVGEALDKAQPAVSDAASSAAHAAQLAQSRAKAVKVSTKGGAKGVSGAVSSAGKGVTGAVGSAVGATTYVTREITGILFWLAALGGLILLVFVPDRDKQEEIWNNIRQFLGEVREMWRDLQSPEYELGEGVDYTDESQTI